MKKRKEYVIVRVFKDGELQRSYTDKRTIYTKADGTEWIRGIMQNRLQPLKRVRTLRKTIGILEVHYKTGKALSGEEFIKQVVEKLAESKKIYPLFGDKDRLF